MDEEGFLYIMSRSDDVINVAGHRLSSGALEEVVQFPPVPFTRRIRMCCDVDLLSNCCSFFAPACGFFCSRCCSTPPWATAPWWGWTTS